MALQLVCPNCGRRPYTEFWFGGERPEPRAAAEGGEVAELDADFARVWLHRNVAGPQRERWFHQAGCRRWLTVTRNTVTHETHGD